MKVKVYFNLHKKMFSVVAMEGDKKGLVIAHENALSLTNATFKVSEAGRQRVLRDKRKNVHAFVLGEWVDASFPTCMDGTEITYNPYKYNSFVRKDNEEPVTKADSVYLDGRRIWIN